MAGDRRNDAGWLCETLSLFLAAIAEIGEVNDAVDKEGTDEALGRQHGLKMLLDFLEQIAKEGVGYNENKDEIKFRIGMMIQQFSKLQPGEELVEIRVS